MLRPGSVLPSEMNRPMCWDWSGSVDDGIRQIARQVGYTVISPPLRGGRTISIHEDHATAGELINQIAAAANPYLNVDVDILNHTIRVTQNA
ncbi:DotD/TraH family lipoprotein [Acetobacter syzygii]|nr:DotD/TraH family lipoprotein [Acetobacter syzygii]